MPEFTARQLAGIAAGRLIGNGDVTVRHVASLDAASGNDVAFLRDEQRRAQAQACHAGVLVTPVELSGFPGTMILCQDVELAMVAVLAALDRRGGRHPVGVSEQASIGARVTIGAGAAVGEFAVIGPGTTVGENAVIHPNVYVGPECRIGPRTLLYSGVRVHDGCHIGADCVVHYNAVIGARGFGFIQRQGTHLALAHPCSVQIGDNVEIGALTTVDRGMLETTVIEEGVKCDNHCHIAHNCHIGAHSILAGDCKLAGSVRLGKRVMVGGACVFRDHVSVGDGAVIAGGSAVIGNVPDGEVWFGAPARRIGEQRRILAMMARLPQMGKRLRELERKVEELTGDRGE